MPAGTDNVTDFFPVLTFTMEERRAYCERVWGVTPREEWTNVELWGKRKYMGAWTDCLLAVPTGTLS